MGHAPLMTMGPKWIVSEPEVDQKWNAKDLQAKGAYTLRFFDQKLGHI